MAGKKYSAAPRGISLSLGWHCQNIRSWVSVGLLAGLCPAMMLVAADTPAATRPARRGAAAATGPATQPRTADQKKQDDIARVMEFFRITQPDVYDQAKNLHDTDPKKFEQLIMGATPTVNHLEGLRKKDPQVFELSMQEMKLNYQSLRIANELKQPGLADADRKRLTEELKTTVAADFDVQQQIRQLEIDDLKQKLADLDNTVHAREQEKADIIRQRTSDLMERTPGVDW